MIPVEAETRITDLQAQHRRIQLKLRDAGLTAVIVVAADTDSNRLALRAAAGGLIDDYPISARSCLASLRSGRHPGGSAIVLL